MRLSCYIETKERCYPYIVCPFKVEEMFGNVLKYKYLC